MASMKNIAKFYVGLLASLKDARYEECPHCGKFWYGKEWMDQKCSSCLYPNHYPDFEQQYGGEEVQKTDQEKY